jgi:hypothetical protein
MSSLSVVPTMAIVVVDHPAAGAALIAADLALC